MSNRKLCDAILERILVEQAQAVMHVATHHPPRRPDVPVGEQRRAGIVDQLQVVGEEIDQRLAVRREHAAS
ncbi:MAG: hypothetical protein R3E96_10200 [Planctomycetota bacterium]